MPTPRSIPACPDRHGRLPGLQHRTEVSPAERPYPAAPQSGRVKGWGCCSQRDSPAAAPFPSPGGHVVVGLRFRAGLGPFGVR